MRGSSSFLSFRSDASLTFRSLGISGTPQGDVDRALTSRGSLQALARQTGGRSLAASRGFETALRHVEHDLASYYSIGFLPPAEGAGEVHRIKVRLPGRPGAVVRHRESYRLKTRDQESVERTVAALLLEDPENPLAVEVTAGEPQPASRRGVRVPLAITVPLARLALVADGRAHAGRLSIFVTSGGSDRGAASVRKAVVPVRIANDELLTSLGRRVEYKMELELRASERIAVTVRDDFRPRISTALVTPRL